MSIAKTLNQIQSAKGVRKIMAVILFSTVSMNYTSYFLVFSRFTIVIMFIALRIIIATSQGPIISKCVPEEKNRNRFEKLLIPATKFIQGINNVEAVKTTAP